MVQNKNLLHWPEEWHIGYSSPGQSASVTHSPERMEVYLSHQSIQNLPTLLLQPSHNTGMQYSLTFFNKTLLKLLIILLCGAKSCTFLINTMVLIAAVACYRYAWSGGGRILFESNIAMAASGNSYI